MKKLEWNLLPQAYQRWPALAGVAAGLWLLVLMYLGRMLYYLVQGERKVAGFSLLWCVICYLLWRLLNNWARKRTAG